MTVLDGARSRHRRRRSGVLVAVALAVIVLVAVVTALRGGDGATDRSAATTSSVAPTSTAAGPSATRSGATSPPTSPPPTTGSAEQRQRATDRLVEAIPQPRPVPDGDYRAICRQLNGDLAGVTPPTDVVSFLDLLDRLDVGRLAVLAPAGVRASFADLLDTLPVAARAVERAGGVPDPADLPPRFLPAVTVLGSVAGTRCGIGAPG